MDPALIASAATALVGILGAALAWKNRKRDDEGKAVQAATGIFDAYKGLVEDLQRTVARLAEERDRAQARYEQARQELADRPDRIEALETVRDDLEAKLAASIAELHKLVEQAQETADDIKDVADEAEEAANGG